MSALDTPDEVADSGMRAALLFVNSTKRMVGRVAASAIASASRSRLA
jgi:hypothetical protein